MFFGTFNIIMGIITLLIGFKIYKPFKKDFIEKNKIDYRIIKLLGVFFIFGGVGLILLELR